MDCYDLGKCIQKDLSEACFQVRDILSAFTTVSIEKIFRLKQMNTDECIDFTDGKYYEDDMGYLVKGSGCSVSFFFRPFIELGIMKQLSQ